MRKMVYVIVPLLIGALGAGCGSTGKRVQELERKQQQQQTYLQEIASRIDNMAAQNRENAAELTAIRSALDEMESRSIDALGSNSPAIQEIRENIDFLNDQVVRLDSAIRSARPAALPKAASAFKPGGFEIKDSYDKARADYEARRFESAISGFTEVLTVAPQSSLADNAQYWIGESYYSMGDYENAVKAFTKVFNFPESNKIADAHFKIGKSYLLMDRKDPAKDEFRAVVQNHPGTDAARYASQELSKLGE